jgi:hypothetical protein
MSGGLQIRHALRVRVSVSGHGTAFDSSLVVRVCHGGCGSLTLRMLSSFVGSIPATISSFFSSSRCTGAPDADAGGGPSALGVAAAGDAEGGAMGTDTEEGEGTGTGTTGCGAADTSDMMLTILGRTGVIGAVFYEEWSGGWRGGRVDKVCPGKRRRVWTGPTRTRRGTKKV